MRVRAALVAVTAAALLPFTGTSHASCLDDAQAGLTEGYSPKPMSYGYWPTYLQLAGTATVTFHGDMLVSDYTTLAGNHVQLAQVVAGNAPDTATTFVDCVAG